MQVIALKEILIIGHGLAGAILSHSLLKTGQKVGVIEGKLRMAHARAMSDALVMAVSKTEFEAKIEATDPFVRGLVRILSSRIRDLQDKRN